MWFTGWIFPPSLLTTRLQWWISTLLAYITSPVRRLWDHQELTSQKSADIGEGLVPTAADHAVPVVNVETYTRESKGELLSSGASGIIERLPSGDVSKSPWPGTRAHECCIEITMERDIYERLGCHPRLLRIIGWDPEQCVLTMEYAPNGSLKDFLRAQNDKIPVTQRLHWVQDAAEGLQLLHEASVIHCDVEPRNFLLDANLGIKIADFGGSSLQGSQPSAYAGARFLPPNFDWRRQPTIQDDLFGLGSTIYFIMTGQYPFAELDSDEVEANYRASKFPDLEGITCGDIIKQCWSSEIGSAQAICELIQAII